MRLDFKRSFLTWQGLVFLFFIVLLYFFQTAVPHLERIPNNTYKVINSLTPVDSIVQVKTISDLKKQPLKIAMLDFAEIVAISAGNEETLNLKTWTLNLTEKDPVTPNETQYYEKNGHGFIRKAVILKTDTMSNGDLHHEVQLVDQPVNYRYDVHNKSISIPLGNSYKSLFKVLIYLSGFLFLIYSSSILIQFIDLFKNLKKGIAFTDANVKALLEIGWLLLVYPLVMIILHIMVWLLFKQYIGEEVVMRPVNLPLWVVITAVGFLFLLLHKAFLKGLELLNEAELTI